MLGAYRAAGRLAAPGLRVMLRRRVAGGKEIAERLGERRGIPGLARPPGRLIWFHAASVGETMSILPVIAALGGGAEVLLTTGTVTSARLAAARLPSHARHQLVPLDVPGWGQKFLAHWRPDAAVFVESELWPGLLAAVDARGIPRLLINARMSSASARRWRRIGGLAGPIFAGFRYVHVQSAEAARHLAELGIVNALNWGNLKFYAPLLPVDTAALEALRGRIPGPVWLAASTHEGEEALVLQVHRELSARHPTLVTLIVPRHPHRGGAVAALANGAGRLSQGDLPRPGAAYIADTLGDLGLFYRLAPFAFIGNSLIGYGGHNVIEPARLERAVIVGPHDENFKEPVARLRQAGGLREVADVTGLQEAVSDWLTDPAAAAAAGQAAAAAFEAAADLPARLAALILECAL